MKTIFLNDFNDNENLDPEDWNKFRATAHGMLDEMIDFISNIRNKKVWTPVPALVKDKFKESLPENPSSLEKVYRDYIEYVLPFNRGNIHPRFWGWVDGTGTASGILYEMLSATLNCNIPFGDVAAAHIELQVIKWFSSLFGFPDDAGGAVVSGGSAANLSALAVARNSLQGIDVKKDGLSKEDKLRIYCSTETHNSVQKAVELLGLGSDAIRYIPVDGNFRINTALLKTQIEADRKNGDTPFCIVANLGTVNTGAMDPLDALSRISKEEGLWLHVDGAFGAILAILPEYKEQLAFLKDVDSIAFDFHKWLYIQYDAGCFIVKDGALLKKAFGVHAKYLMHHERGITAGPALNDTRLELSRGMKNLKIWMSLKEHGIEKYRRMIRKNLNQAQYLMRLIEKHPELEMMAPVEMNVVAFRYNSDKQGTDLNALNKEIVMNLQEDGKLLVSSTVLDGKYAIRAAITNHRSMLEDFDLLISETIRWGHESAVINRKETPGLSVGQN